MYNHLGIGRSSIGLNKCIMLLAEGGRGLWDLVVYYCNNFFFFTFLEVSWLGLFKGLMLGQEHKSMY